MHLSLRILCLVGVLSPTTTFAQHEAAPGAAPAATVANTEDRITLNLVVNDKSGIPIPGLQQQDFTVLDNKQPQQILSFQAVGQTRPAEDATEIVVVLDAVNTAFGRVAFEREQIKQLLKQHEGKLAHPVSLDFFSDTGLEIQSSTSRDGNALAAYLDQHETALRTINRAQGYYGAVDRTQLSLQALAQLADYELKRPGRKIVIWVSPGWPLLSGPAVQLSPKEERDIFNTVVATSTELRKANITLDSVDPLGTADSGGFRTFYYEEFLKGATSPKQAQVGNLALQVLAVHSGGRVLNSNNNVAGEIERCMRDADASYVLSYAAPTGDGPNEYHAIEVKSAQSGIKLQTLTGYYARPKPSEAR